MTSTNAKSDIQDELDKAARLINAILRLMHKGAMQHDQARKELSLLSQGIAKAEIDYCVRQALRAVEINEQSLQDKYHNKTRDTHW